MLYLLISALRAAGVFALFVVSWLAAYVAGQVAVRTGLVACADAKSCEMFAGMVVMPLGGVAIYGLTLVVWALAARQGR